MINDKKIVVYKDNKIGKSLLNSWERILIDSREYRM